MCCNDVKGWVNTPNPSSSPCTIHISLSALIIHVQTLRENGVGGVGGEGVVAHSSLHHMKPPFHGWLTWWKVIGGPGKWWSDMVNNFHYVSVTLSHLLINFPLAFHVPLCVGPQRNIPGNLSSLASAWLVLPGRSGLANIADTPCLRWVLVVETNISVCFCRVRFVYPFLSCFL